jgi:hypothetical protein
MYFEVRINDSIMTAEPATLIINHRPASCWVDKAGRMYFVPFCNHSRVAPIIVHDILHDTIDEYSRDMSSHLEDNGWVHFSLAYSSANLIVQHRHNLTQAQADTISDMLYAMDRADYMADDEFDAAVRLMRDVVEYALDNVG